MSSKPPAAPAYSKLSRSCQEWSFGAHAAQSGWLSIQEINGSSQPAGTDQSTGSDQQPGTDQYAGSDQQPGTDQSTGSDRPDGTSQTTDTDPNPSSTQAAAEKTLSYSGTGFGVTLTYGASAGVPDGATLTAEVADASEYNAQTGTALNCIPSMMRYAKYLELHLTAGGQPVTDGRRTAGHPQGQGQNPRVPERRRAAQRK